MHDDNDHRIHHHVQLPGGRQIEVVYLESNRERGRWSPANASATAGRQRYSGGACALERQLPDERSRRGTSRLPEVRRRDL